MYHEMQYSEKLENVLYCQHLAIIIKFNHQSCLGVFSILALISK